MKNPYYPSDQLLLSAVKTGELLQNKSAQSPIKLLQLAAKISRELYDAEKNQLNLLRGISILDAEYTKIKIKQEKRRYQRQKETIKRIMKCDAFIDMLPIKKISDIFWAFTGRDRLIDQLLRD